MFESFDDESAHAFVDCIKNNSILKGRIRSQVKLRRLRNLGEIVNRRVSERFDEIEFLTTLLDETKEKEFFDLIEKKV